VFCKKISEEFPSFLAITDDLASSGIMLHLSFLAATAQINCRAPPLAANESY